MQHHSLPAEDNRLAKQLALQFKISQRDKPRQKWQTVAEPLEGLEAVYLRAQQIEAFEVSIWLVTPNGSLSYWKSSDPELFNSSVIHLVINELA